jgi:hypothetical protein
MQSLLLVCTIFAVVFFGFILWLMWEDLKDCQTLGEKASGIALLLLGSAVIGGALFGVIRLVMWLPLVWQLIFAAIVLFFSTCFVKKKNLVENFAGVLGSVLARIVLISLEVGLFVGIALLVNFVLEL